MVCDSVADNQPKQPLAESGSPTFVEELLKNGTTILTAKTRDELTAMVNDIPADVKYCAGAVGQNFDDGYFTLRIDLTSKD